MNRHRLLWRSLWFYRRTHLGTLLGAALASMILAGALMVGDSVRHSLTRLTASRLGRTDFVVAVQDRFFRADLADRLAKDSKDRIAPVLILQGVVLTPDDDRRVNSVQVVGVDDRFWQLAPEPGSAPSLAPGTGRVNPVLAARIGLSGTPDSTDTLVLRLRKPGGLPADMTLATRDQDSWSRALTVTGVQAPAAFGQFTLSATQRVPPTVYVSRTWLARQLGIEDRANALLIHAADGTTKVDILQDRLHAAWQLDDAGLRLGTAADGSVELTSDHVFIPPRIADTLEKAWPAVRPVTTYFLNRIEAGDRGTPYSFASAPGPPRVPDDMGDDYVKINDWLADDLGVDVGAELTMAYYTVDSGGRLEEQTETFRVAGIVAADAVAATDRGLTPDIPGLSDVDNCRDWDPGIPIDLDQIRDRDEAYWDAYGPLPKVYLTHAAAESLWRNRFGVHTALRFDGDATISTVRDRLHANLTARDLGLVVQPVRETGLAASRDAVDFGHLFIGLSFFLIVAAVLLTVLLFSFSIEQRMEETGTLCALGFTPAAIRRQRIQEGLVLVIAGAAAGGLAARVYNRLILLALRTVWHDAVHTTLLHSHVRPASVLTGMAVVILLAVASMAWVLRGHGRLTVRELQQGTDDRRDAQPRASRWPPAVGGMAVLGALAIALTVPAGQGRDVAGAFFASGSLLLAGLLLLAHAGMGRIRRAPTPAILTRGRLILRTVALRRGRSLACLALMALGVFLVMAVAANRRGTVRDPTDRASGTGGWLLWGQTTLPLVHDVNSQRGRARFGLSDAAFDAAVFTQLRFRKGDDASCLNLNRVATPHLLGIDPRAWDRRGPFTFARLADGVDRDHPWRTLATELDPDTIPAFADMADIVWGLGTSVGDTLVYTDEQGQTFKIKLMGGLAPSILQGHLVISEDHLTERYPSTGGAHVLLVDAPPETAERLERLLTRRLGDLGLACMRTDQRLSEFNRVENTYLSIFMLLGGLGVLVGSAGLGIVAARNILERRAELALLRAVGYRRRQLRWLLFLEHGSLALAGIAGGTLSAALAVTPALLAPETVVPWRGLALIFAGLWAGSLLWIALAIRITMRGPLIPALRAE